MNQIVTLTAVEEKKRGTNKRGEWALRIFKTAGGTSFQTFDIDLGDKATGLLNQQVSVDYETEENGNFTNNVLKSIAAHAPDKIDVAKFHVAGSVNAASQDEFRRSKEEMRRTESVKAAATILASPNWTGALDIASLGVLAEKIAGLIESGPATDDVQF